MDREELGAWLRLLLCPGVGNGAARRLLAAFGMPQAVFLQTEAVLGQCVNPQQVQSLRKIAPDWEQLLDTTWQWLNTRDTAGTGRAVISLADPRYPPMLLEIEDPPLLLYATGPERLLERLPLLQGRCLAVVGSRNPTAQGAENARMFARTLGSSGLTIVSGLALGVDAAAHEGALDAALVGADEACTIAVVGTGLDRVYPRRNLELARRIAACGLLISEYPLGTPPIPGNFPKRNRIISGLSQGTLVVEAALASGSLITARLAAEQGREVFAIPGSIHAPQSRGCHALIRQGAKLVESAADVLEELQIAAPPSPQKRGEADDAFEMAGGEQHRDEPAESPLLRALGFDPMGVDALVARTGMDAASLQVTLLELELDGHVARLPGGLFQRLGRA